MIPHDFINFNPIVFDKLTAENDEKVGEIYKTFTHI